MFVRQPARESLAVSSGDILLLLISLNRPMVALEDYATDEADATICTVRRESDMVSTVVHLLLQQGRTALFYTFESDPYPEDLRGPVEEEAVDFVESLGFIMDDTRFADIGPDAQKELLERPIFTGALAESPPPGAAEPAFEVPPDPAFQYDPMPPESLDALDPGSAAPAEPLAPAPETPRREAPGPPPAGDPFQVALPEASLQEMEIVLDEVFQDPRSMEARAQGRHPEPAPLPLVTPSGTSAPEAGGSLSRFRRRGAAADLYTIHGIGGEEQIAEPGAPVRSAPAPAAAPARVEATPLPPSESPPADPDLRRRRARARFLASF